MVRHALSCAVVVAFAGFVAAEDWPQWRGPDRTGISADTGLLKEWPKDGPPLRWKAADIGTGYSAPIVVKGRVYLQTTAPDFLSRARSVAESPPGVQITLSPSTRTDSA